MAFSQPHTMISHLSTQPRGIHPDLDDWIYWGVILIYIELAHHTLLSLLSTVIPQYIKGLCVFKVLHLSDFCILKHCGAAVGHVPDSIIFCCAFCIVETYAFVQWKSSYVFNYFIIGFLYIGFSCLEELLYIYNWPVYKIVILSASFSLYLCNR